MLKKNNYGIAFVIFLFILATVLGIVVFKNYIYSAKVITSSLEQIQKEGPSLTIEDCAEKVISWYSHCDAMTQMCDDTVSRMAKICLSNGSKEKQCAKYGAEVYGYNFGAVPCAPYLKNRPMKKACADTWQAVADYCKAAQKVK